jgi:hypothetical protein
MANPNLLKFSSSLLGSFDAAPGAMGSVALSTSLGNTSFLESLDRLLTETFAANLQPVFIGVFGLVNKLVFATTYQLQVLNSIVSFISVNMMNLFVRPFKFTAKFLLHKVTMFHHVFAANSNHLVALGQVEGYSLSSIHHRLQTPVGITVPSFSKIVDVAESFADRFKLAVDSFTYNHNLIVT